MPVYGGSVGQVAQNEMQLSREQRAAAERMLQTILAQHERAQQRVEGNRDYALKQQEQQMRAEQFAQTLRANEAQNQLHAELQRRQLGIAERNAATNEEWRKNQAEAAQHPANNPLQTFLARQKYEEEQQAIADAQTDRFAGGLAQTGNRLLDLDRQVGDIAKARAGYKAGRDEWSPIKTNDDYRREAMGNLPYDVPLGTPNWRGAPTEEELNTAFAQGDALTGSRDALRRYFEGATAKGANADLIAPGPDGRYQPIPRRQPMSGPAPAPGSAPAPAATPQYQPGKLYRQVDGSAMRFLGGNPMDPKSWQIMGAPASETNAPAITLPSQSIPGLPSEPNMGTNAPVEQFNWSPNGDMFASPVTNSVGSLGIPGLPAEPQQSPVPRRNNAIDPAANLEFWLQRYRTNSSPTYSGSRVMRY